MQILDIVLLIIFFVIPSLAVAQEEKKSLEEETVFRSSAYIFNFPYDRLDGIKSMTGVDLSLRQVVRKYFSDDFSIIGNAYALMESASVPDSTGLTSDERGTSSNQNRSTELQRVWNDTQNTEGSVVVDELFINGKMGKVNYKIGRQPINLATTFYFTPNDFFAPFLAQSVYRVYKPGVDAARVDINLAELSEFSVIGVAGYKTIQTGQYPSLATENRWVPDEGSLLGRYSVNISGTEFSLLGGKLAEENVVGFSLQTSLPLEIEFRSEGHRRINEYDKSIVSDEVALGLQKRLTEKLLVQVEQYYNSAGYTNASDYMKFSTDKNPPRFYLGEHYSAFGGSYDFSALWTTTFLIMGNLDDESVLATLNQQYSISNEADISVSLYKPWGKRPDGLLIRSEFGSYPEGIMAATTAYF